METTTLLVKEMNLTRIGEECFEIRGCELAYIGDIIDPDKVIAVRDHRKDGYCHGKLSRRRVSRNRSEYILTYKIRESLAEMSLYGSALRYSFAGTGTDYEHSNWDGCNAVMLHNFRTDDPSEKVVFDLQREKYFIVRLAKATEYVPYLGWVIVREE